MHEQQPLYILMLSLHGLVRGQELELGRDSDTGGQITYVVELARALGRNPEVDRVDLLTRLIEDPSVSVDYAQPEEALGPNARIVRLPFGPRRYVRKESLWNHLDQLVDRCLNWLRQQGRLPDLIHTHYADAGYVGVQLSRLLGIPQVHTGHSLGRCKRERLLASGRKPSAIDRQFNFDRRIHAEEETLSNVSLLVASTRQEIGQQYGLYENFDSARGVVIPPGTDTSRFSPPGRSGPIDERIREMVDRFLYRSGKPMILTICRPDMRKNLHALIEAYGGSAELQQLANLVIVAGNRDDIRVLEQEQQAVLSGLLLDIDRYDLYGKVAIPKHHTMEDVPELYRLAARRRGLFINPALTEPFGLTLLEAAASGLPVVATTDGGPTDILGNCRNGMLVDPLDPQAIAATLISALAQREQWRKWSRNGIAGVKRHYTWDAHVAKYLKAVRRVLHRDRKRVRRQLAVALHQGKSALPLAKFALISDIDNTLTGDAPNLVRLVDWLQQHASSVAFGIATGRSLQSALRVLREWRIPVPDVLVTSVGSEIHYRRKLAPDQGWTNHIRHQWRRDALAEALADMPGLRLQARENQREFKLSYLADPEEMPPLKEIYRHLHSRKLHANLIYSHEAYLDVLPVRASKGQAIRYLAYKWGLPLKSFLVAGDSGNDIEMLVGDTLGVIVGNFSPELAPLRGFEQVYFAHAHHADGVMEGIEHYRFAEVGALQAEEASHD